MTEGRRKGSLRCLALPILRLLGDRRHPTVIQGVSGESEIEIGSACFEPPMGIFFFYPLFRNLEFAWRFGARGCLGFGDLWSNRMQAYAHNACILTYFVSHTHAHAQYIFEKLILNILNEAFLKWKIQYPSMFKKITIISVFMVLKTWMENSLNCYLHT